MAHLFINDGYPDADEYDSNFISFDEHDPQDMRRALEAARLQRRRLHAARPSSDRED